jgi:hypothetical protein
MLDEEKRIDKKVVDGGVGCRRVRFLYDWEKGDFGGHLKIRPR